jgi:MFS family permease
MTVPSAANDSAVTGTAVPGLWRNRNFRWLWFGQAVSTLGDEVYDITMVLWVATVIARNEPWAPMAVAGLALAVLVPTLLFSLIGGVYADRWDRRRTMLAADAVRAVLTGCLCVLAVAGPALSRPVLLTAVYFLAGLTRIAALFFDPARYGLLAAVVDDADRERMGSITMRPRSRSPTLPSSG